MSITIHTIQGFSCPFFRCDICTLRIERPRLAMAAWGENWDDRSSASPIQPAHVHKGICLDTFEECLPKGSMLMTVELTEHVEYLLRNSRLKPRTRAEAVET